MHSNGKKLIDRWEDSSQEERKEFLLELHRRYRFERICNALIKHPDGILCSKPRDYMAELIESADNVLYKIDILKRITRESTADG